MHLHDLLSVLKDIAPLHLADPHDNVGLLAGDPAQAVARVMLTIDCTSAVVDEAVREKCDVVISYHPPIYPSLTSLCAGHPVFESIRNGIAIYSPHTAFDVAKGGTNDVLADAIMLRDRQPLRSRSDSNTHFKLITFVPAEALERVSEALFLAGAGLIGNYQSCSFRSPGTGTFFGHAGTQPAVGQSGVLEHVAEIRLETLLPVARVDDALAALRATHPYEEPAFDLLRLHNPDRSVGMGRAGIIDPISRQEVIDKLKRALGLNHLLVAGPMSGEVRRVAICAGSGREFLADARAFGADLFITGELRHHDVLATQNMTVVCTLHSNSERAALGSLKKSLESRLPKLTVIHSRVDRDPFSIA